MKRLVLLLLGSLALNGCATAAANDKNYGYGPDYREPTYKGPPLNIQYSQP